MTRAKAWPLALPHRANASLEKKKIVFLAPVERTSLAARNGVGVGGLWAGGRIMDFPSGSRDASDGPGSEMPRCDGQCSVSR
jgi:hypothetical protein